MKVHEYEAELSARYGVPIPRGRVAETADEAAAIAKALGVPVAVKVPATPKRDGIPRSSAPRDRGRPAAVPARQARGS